MEWIKENWFVLPEFTGNWFIDINIYGFYKCIKNSGINESALIYNKNGTIAYDNRLVYGIYPIYYIFYRLLKAKEKKTKEKKVDSNSDNEEEKIKVLCKEAYEKIIKNERDKERILKIALSYIKQNFKRFVTEDKGEDANPLKGKVQFYKNYSFTNENTYKKFEEKFKLHFLYRKEDEEETETFAKLFGQTGNKFLFSKNSFGLISFAKSELDIDVDSLIENNIYPFILINYDLAFTDIYKNRRIIFYSPSRELTFSVNDKLSNAYKTEERVDILSRIIPASLIEIRNKVWFSLNQMFLIEYVGPDRQQRISDATYIGFPPHIAKLLTSDRVIKSVDKKIKIKISDKEPKWVYLLAELEKGRPFTPIILKSIMGKIEENMKINTDLLALDCLRFDKTKKTINPYSKQKADYSIEDLDNIKNKLKKYKSLGKILKRVEPDLDPDYFIRLVITGSLTDFNYKIAKCFLKNSKEIEKNYELLYKFLKDNCRENYWPAYSTALIAGFLEVR